MTQLIPLSLCNGSCSHLILTCAGITIPPTPLLPCSCAALRVYHTHTTAHLSGWKSLEVLCSRHCNDVSHSHIHTYLHIHPPLSLSLLLYPSLPSFLSFRVTAVVMFFLESSVLGYCVERLAFLLIINKYLQPWMRAVLYMGSVPWGIPQH